MTKKILGRSLGVIIALLAAPAWILLLFTSVASFLNTEYAPQDIFLMILMLLIVGVSAWAIGTSIKRLTLRPEDAFKDMPFRIACAIIMSVSTVSNILVHYVL